MRFWLKLLLMACVAGLAQWEVERHAGWLDDQWFAVRVGVHNLVPGADPCDPKLLAAARELWLRDEERAARRVAAVRVH